MATWTHPSPGGRFWMNNWLTKVFSLYLVEVNFSSDFSFWLSSLWPSAFSVSYLSCDFFFLTMRIVTRSRRVKAVTAPMTIGRRRSISAPKASCLCKKKWPRHTEQQQMRNQNLDSTHRRVGWDPGTPSVKLLIKNPTFNLRLLVINLRASHHQYIARGLTFQKLANIDICI